jgi:hypothetical protein
LAEDRELRGRAEQVQTVLDWVLGKPKVFVVLKTTDVEGREVLREIQHTLLESCRDVAGMLSLRKEAGRHASRVCHG